METSINHFVKNAEGSTVLKARIRKPGEACFGWVDIQLDDGSIFLLRIDAVDVNGNTEEGLKLLKAEQAKVIRAKRNKLSRKIAALKKASLKQ